MPMSDDDTGKRLGSGRQSRKDKDKSSKKAKVKEEKEAKEVKDDSKVDLDSKPMLCSC